jgi:uridine kinase
MQQRPFVLGVAGGTGSGKITVSNKIQKAIGLDNIAYLQHDSYYYDHGHLSPEERAKSNYDHPNSLDTGLLVNHLERLVEWQPIDVPLYDFATHRDHPGGGHSHLRRARIAEDDGYARLCRYCC